jgi:MraZ protein
MAFRGTFEYTLDAKNRLTVPARFRAALAEGVVLAKGDGTYLEVWRPEEYERRTEAALQGFHPRSPDAATLRRFWFSNSADTELDSAGRVMVPGFLLEHAGLDKDVVVVGAGDCLEVWERSRWSDYNAALPAEVSDITARLGHPA